MAQPRNIVILTGAGGSAESGVPTARVRDHVSLGAGYRYAKYAVRATKRDFRGRLNYEFTGPVVTAELTF